MGSPASVSDSRVRVENFGQVDIGLSNQFLELSNLSHLFEGEYLIFLIPIHGQTSRIVATVFEPR